MSLNHAYSPYEIYFGDGEPMVDAARTLFVGDLSYFCTDQDLIGLFTQFGPVIKAHVRRGVTGDSLMHGFVAVESPESAQFAIQKLNGYEFMGRNIRVQLSSDTSRPNPNAKDVFVQVHVSFISRQIQIIIGEKVLRDIFSPYGVIGDVTVKKHTLNMHRQSGYGFVYFVDTTAAYQALHSLKHTTIYDITFDCSISHKSEDQLVKQHPAPYYRSNSSNSSTPSGSPKNLIAFQQQQQQLQQQKRIDAERASPVIDHRALLMRNNSNNSNSSTTLAMVSNDSRDRGWSISSEYDPTLYSPVTSGNGNIPGMHSPSMSLGRPIVKAKSVGGASPVITYEASPGGTYHTGPLAYQAVASPLYTQPPSANSSTTQRLLKNNTLSRMRLLDGLAVPNVPPPPPSLSSTGYPLATSPTATQSAANAFPLAAPLHNPGVSHMTPAMMAQHRRTLAAATTGTSGNTNGTNTSAGTSATATGNMTTAGMMTTQSATQLEDILSTLRINTAPGGSGLGGIGGGVDLTNGVLPATYPHVGTPTSLHSSPTYRNNTNTINTNTTSSNYAMQHPSYSSMTNSSATTNNSSTSSSTSASNSNSQYGQFLQPHSTPPSPWWEQPGNYSNTQQQQQQPSPMMHTHSSYHSMHAVDQEMMMYESQLPPQQLPPPQAQGAPQTQYALPTTTSLPNHPHYMNALSNTYGHVQQPPQHQSQYQQPSQYQQSPQQYQQSQYQQQQSYPPQQQQYYTSSTTTNTTAPSQGQGGAGGGYGDYTGMYHQHHQQQEHHQHHQQQQQPQYVGGGGYEGMQQPSGSSSQQYPEHYLDTTNIMSHYNVFAPSSSSVYSSNDSSKLSSPTAAHFSKLPSPTSANISKISSPTASMSTTVSTLSEVSSVVMTTTFPAAATEGMVSIGSE